MIKEVKAFVVECDSCKKLYEDYDGMSIFVDKNRDMMLNSDWIMVDGKDYCENCYFINDKDEVILDKSKFDTYVCTDCKAVVKLPPNDKLNKGEVAGYCNECGHVIWK